MNLMASLHLKILGENLDLQICYNKFIWVALSTVLYLSINQSVLHKGGGVNGLQIKQLPKVL